MPSPRHPRALSFMPNKRKAADMPPRARQLVEVMVYGIDDRGPLSLKDTAAAMGIGLSTARGYFRHARARAYHLQLIGELREGEKARNIATAVGIRDDSGMSRTAAGNRVRIEAARFLEGEPTGPTINVNVGVQVQPGYAIVIHDDHAAAADRLLRKAGSTRRIGDDGGTVEIEHEPATPRRQGRAIEPSADAPAGDSGGWGRAPFDQLPPADSRRRTAGKWVEPKG